MEVQAGTGVSQIIVHREQQPIANGPRYERRRPLSVDTNCWFVESTIGIGSDPSNGVVFNDCLSAGRARCKHQSRQQA